MPSRVYFAIKLQRIDVPDRRGRQSSLESSQYDLGGNLGNQGMTSILSLTSVTATVELPRF